MHRETPAQFVGVSDSDIDVMSEIDINLTFDSLVSHHATAAPVRGNQNHTSEEESLMLDVLDQCTIVVYTLDTGATHTLSKSTLGQYLQNSVKSALMISGYKGSQADRGHLHGTIAGFVVGSDIANQDWKSNLVPIQFSTDTIDDLNDNLLSFTSFYEKQNYRCNLGQPGEFSGFYRIDKQGNWIDKVPMTYDHESHQWTMTVVAAKDFNRAKQLGSILQQRKKQNNSYTKSMAKANCFTVEDAELIVDIFSDTGSEPESINSVTATVLAISAPDKDPDEGNPSCLNAIKTGKLGRMTEKQRHEFLGHHNHMDGCPLCMQTKKNLNVIRSNPVAKRDSRPGYTWDCDIIYWSFGNGVSKRGFRYTFLLNDSATNTELNPHFGTRDEAPASFKSTVLALRAEKRFDQPYPIVSRVNFDQAGELIGKEMLAVLKELGITEINIADNTRKEDNGRAENAVKRHEIQVKKAMAQTSAPPQFFCYFSDYATHLNNRLASNRNIHTRDGDGPRPLELLLYPNYSRNECNADIARMEIPLTLVMCTDKDSKGSDLDRVDRCSLGFTLGNKNTSPLEIGHLTIVENPYTSTKRATKSFVAMPRRDGQNVWQMMNLPVPVTSKSSVIRSGTDSFPVTTVIKMPFTLTPTIPNETITGLKFTDESYSSVPGLHYFDQHGRCMILDPQSGSLEPGNIALPAILDLLEISKFPDIDPQSRDYLIAALATNPKMFIGRPIYQHFAEADPPGTYQGEIMQHLHDIDDGNFFQVQFEPVGNNHVHITEYDDQDMIKYCIDGDDTDVITTATIDDMLLKQDKLYQNLDDFELFQTADNDTFAKICEKIGIKRNERVMYYNWLVKHFGYGPDASQHPDSINFICPFTHNGMKGGMGKLVKPPPKFKVGTRFPIPAGTTWLFMQTQADAQSNAANSEYIEATNANIRYAEVVEEQRLNAKDTNPLISSGGCGITGSHHNMAFIEELFDMADSVQDVEEMIKLCTEIEFQDSTKLPHTVEDLDRIASIHAARMASTPTLQELVDKYVTEDSPYVDDVGKITPPTSFKDARSRSDWPLWEYAWQSECDSFTKHKVHSEKMTRGQVRKLGYHQQPIRTHFMFTCKYDIKSGKFLKPKARWVVEGTPRNCRKYEHYWEAYSPAPTGIAVRLLQALACRHDKKRHACDVDVAFLNSVLQPHEMLPLIMPPGMEEVSGEQVYDHVILYRGQYGLIPAGFYWERTRNAFLLEEFNKHPFKCVQLKLEPCMFIITNTDTDAVTHLLIHVDDIDAICDDSDDVVYIFGQLARKFGIKECDPDIMLGIQLKMSLAEGIRFLDITI